MFPLTRPFRQGLATAAILVFTVLPTAFVALYAWRVNRPGHIRDVEIELGRQLGLQATLEAVRYPKPGELVYQGIVLRQEEPRGKRLIEIARAGLVRLVRSERELTLHAENLKLSGESPKQALRRLERCSSALAHCPSSGSTWPLLLASLTSARKDFGTRSGTWRASLWLTHRTRHSVLLTAWSIPVQERVAN